MGNLSIRYLMREPAWDRTPIPRRRKHGGGRKSKPIGGRKRKPATSREKTGSGKERRGREAADIAETLSTRAAVNFRPDLAQPKSRTDFPDEVTPLYKERRFKIGVGCERHSRDGLA